MPRFIYEADFEKQKYGGYYVNFPQLEGAYTYGSTLNEAVLKAADVLELIICCYLDDGMKLPVPKFKGNKGKKFRVAVSVKVTKKMRKYTRYCNTKTASYYLGVSKSKIKKLVKKGELKTKTFGKKQLVEIASANKYLADK